MSRNVEDAIVLCRSIEENIGRVIVGKEATIRLIMIALTAGGHLLIEDVPGIGKTTMVRALARSLDLQFSRIQFTPDVMPSDVTGYNIFNPMTGVFEFRPGAIMTQILLADEINRTSPKTQSALLEAMQENQVTVDRRTYHLPRPFIVLATESDRTARDLYTPRSATRSFYDRLRSAIRVLKKKSIFWIASLKMSRWKHYNPLLPQRT